MSDTVKYVQCYLEPPCIMSVQYTEGCTVQWEMFNTPGGYHEYAGDIMSILGGFQYTGGYLEYTRGIS